jgi:hypothetical protein
VFGRSRVRISAGTDSRPPACLQLAGAVDAVRELTHSGDEVARKQAACVRGEVVSLTRWPRSTPHKHFSASGTHFS